MSSKSPGHGQLVADRILDPLNLQENRTELNTFKKELPTRFEPTVSKLLKSHLLHETSAMIGAQAVSLSSLLSGFKALRPSLKALSVAGKRFSTLWK